MSSLKIKCDSYFVGGRHLSATTKIYDDITSKGSKVLIGYYLCCKRKKSITDSDITIQAECLGDFLKNSCERTKNTKKMAKNRIKNPGRTLDFTANIATAAASRNPKNEMSTLSEPISFYNTGEGF